MREDRFLVKNKLHIQNLGSSSSGNSTLLWSADSAILIDIGFSQRYTLQQLADIGIDFASLNGILITHLHGDHINRATLNLAIKSGIPVWFHANLYKTLRYRFKVKESPVFKTFQDEPFEIAEFKISGFEVPHDSAGGCYGYNIFAGTRKVTIATDLGYSDNGIIQNFKDSNLIIIESNHDVRMLSESGRPQVLIKRIVDSGHLSNEQCVSFLDQVFTSSSKQPEALLLAHLSAECNLPELAERGARNLLERHDLNRTLLQVLKKNEPSETITLE